MLSNICIIDAGGQYTKVIDRRIRELNVKSEIVGTNASLDHLKACDGIIISGGPSSVTDSNAPQLSKEIFNLDVPILGICWGMQFMNYSHGGEVKKLDKREDGVFEIDIQTSKLFKNLGKKENVLLTHGDSITKVSDEFNVISMSSGIVAAIEHKSKSIYGVQFHPEVDLTTNGQQIFSNFIDICGCKRDFTSDFRDEQCIREIQETVGANGKILVLVSGGVDSSVLAALCFKAVGADRVKCLHIDNGFMRKGESENVVKDLAAAGINCELLDCSHQFYNASCAIQGNGKTQFIQEPSQILCKTIEPEQKRKIIGDTFIRIVQIESAKRGMSIDSPDVYLAQGTLRPDLIESASKSVSGNADTIKTHHNDSPMARQYREAGRLVEPLKDFHKDEVRRLGQRLGLPEGINHRQPFPGPGLAIRVLCADNNTVIDDDGSGPSLKMLSNYSHSLKTPHILLEKIKQSLSESEHSRLEQFTSKSKFYTSTVPIKSVGVQGDCRSYSRVACISGPPDWENLAFLAKLIPRICHSINRVCYVIGEPIKETHFPDDTTPTTLSTHALEQLRECDYIAHKIMKDNNCESKLSQMPVVLLPLHFDREPYSTKVGSCQRSIVLRPFISKDFMTGVAAIPGNHIPVDVVNKIAEEIRKVPGITRVLYDLTSKPPGTTEWE